MSSLGRLLLSIPALALALGLPACGPTVIGCADDSGDGATLPDGSFEEQPTMWTLAAHSTIDDQEAVCGGASSLRVELDQGIGTGEVTRSAPFAGLEPNKEYEVNFHYRQQHCKAAVLVVHIGNYEKQIQFEGNGGWGDTSLAITVGSEPTWVDIHPMRVGAAGDFATAEHDDNLMWVDDFTITAL